MTENHTKTFLFTTLDIITIKKIDGYENIYNVNPLHLWLSHTSGYIEVEAVSSREFDYEKDYLKIKFNFDDGLPLNKPLKFHLMTIVITSVFEEDSKLYPQVFLDDTLYELSI